MKEQNIDFFSESNKYGFILFDKNINSTKKIKLNEMSGLACTYQGTPFAFKKIKELPPNIVWLTNLDKFNVWRTGQFNNIKSKDYLGIDIKVIIQNYFTQVPYEEITKQMAYIFTQIMFHIERVYREIFEKKFGRSFEIDLKKDELFEDIYQNFLKKSFNPNTTKPLRGCFESAYIEKINLVNEKPSKDDFTFYFENEYYLQRLFEDKIPVGSWYQEKVMENKQAFLQWLEDCVKKDVKLLVKVNQLYFKPLLTNAISHSTNKIKQVDIGELWLGKRNFAFTQRNLEDLWLTEKECLFLSKYADFNVEDIYVNKMAKSFVEKNKQWFDIDVFKTTSLTQYGLLYQTIIASFIKGMKNIAYHNNEKTPYTENMVWLRAKDREICLDVAIKMVEMGLKVKSYGNGEITVDLKSSQYNENDLTGLLLEKGLFVPIGLIKDSFALLELGDDNYYVKSINFVDSKTFKEQQIGLKAKTTNPNQSIAIDDKNNQNKINHSLSNISNTNLLQRINYVDYVLKFFNKKEIDNKKNESFLYTIANYDDDKNSAKDLYKMLVDLEIAKQANIHFPLVEDLIKIFSNIVKERKDEKSS